VGSPRRQGHRRCAGDRAVASRRCAETGATGSTGVVTRPLDGDALSLAGNAHAGEGSRGGATTSPPATMAKTLDLALDGGG
jgi:hypothetical protein